jgi:hypothetical protein
MARAYLAGYLSAVAPRLLTLVLQHLARRRHANKEKTSTTARDPQHGEGESFLAGLHRILCGGLDLRRFPTFCALLVGSASLLEVSLISPNIARVAPACPGDLLPGHASTHGPLDLLLA